MKKILFILTIISIGFSSCKNLVPYTDSLAKTHGWKEVHLTHIQFYLSDEILLERKLVSGLEDDISGKVVSKNGVITEQIFLKKNLPVAFAGISESGSFLIKCKVGEDNTLTFGANPNQNGKYVLLASEWNPSYGKVHYNCVEFFTSNDNIANLLIDLRRKVDSDDSFERLKGVKVR